MQLYDKRADLDHSEAHLRFINVLFMAVYSACKKTILYAVLRVNNNQHSSSQMQVKAKVGDLNLTC